MISSLPLAQAEEIYFALSINLRIRMISRVKVFLLLGWDPLPLIIRKDMMPIKLIEGRAPRAPLLQLTNS
jgi:hypothetical protein